MGFPFLSTSLSNIKWKLNIVYSIIIMSMQSRTILGILNGFGNIMITNIFTKIAIDVSM